MTDLKQSKDKLGNDFEKYHKRCQELPLTKLELAKKCPFKVIWNVALVN